VRLPRWPRIVHARFWVDDEQTGSNRNWRISDTSRPETAYQLWLGCDKSSRQLLAANCHGRGRAFS